MLFDLNIIPWVGDIYDMGIYIDKMKKCKSI